MLPSVVVASVDVPVTLKTLDTVEVPATRVVVVAFVAVRFVKKAETAFNRVVKKLLLVAFVMEAEPIAKRLAVVVPFKDILFKADIIVLVDTPFTIEISVFVVVEKVRAFTVDEATRFVRSVLVDTPFMMLVSMEPETDRVFEFTILLVDITPFTDEVAMLPPVVNELLEITDVVETTPFTVLVKTFPKTDCVNEFINKIMSEEIPFIIFVNVLLVVDTVLLFIKFVLVVDSFPFTVLESIKLFVVVDIVRAFTVLLATKFVRSLEVAIPFTIEDNTEPETERVFVFMILLVLVTPLTFIPKVFIVDEVVALEITLLVATTPFIVVVRILPESV